MLQKYALFLKRTIFANQKKTILVKFFPIITHIYRCYARNRAYQLFLLLSIGVILSSCSATRFVPEGQYLLSSVRLRSEQPEVLPSDYRTYVRQEANSRWLSTVKVPLGIYCLSGTNEKLLINRVMHRVGEAPVVYDPALMQYSQASLASALRAKGYLQATVTVDSTLKGRRVHLRYTMHPRQRSYVVNVYREFDNEAVRQVVERDSASSLLYKGMPLDLGLLNEERSRIVHRLQNAGFMNINNEFVTFTADTTAHSHAVDLTLRILLPPKVESRLGYQRYRIGKVTVQENALEEAQADTTYYRKLYFVSHGGQRINRRVYARHLFIEPDSLYRDVATQYSYQNLNSLGAINFSTIHYATPELGDSTLDVNVAVQLAKPHGISFDIEGTNTAGDLGGAASFTYTHRNLFKGAENFSLKLRGAYETISRLQGYANQNYIEYGAEAALRFPSLPLSFGERMFRTYRGITEFSLLYNSQNRPEFYRRLLTGTWSTTWNAHRKPNLQHRFDIVSLNYVFMPWISSTFRREYLEGDNPRYAVLRNSYENLFIMRSAYGIVYNSLRGRNGGSLNQTNGYQIKANVETAGNVLYGVAKMLQIRRNLNNAYAILNIPFSQYVKFDFDYSKSFRFTEASSLAVHAAFGLAIPYGNSEIIPYEKRYFAGGANSVRGWNVRTLGPGGYVGRDGNIDFINQTGNLKLDLSVEYRAALFWKFEGAAFVDAGNVWNTRNHADLSNGQFQFNNFYRQIAVAYGLGLRLNLNYFIIRLDGGMKAINPSVMSGRGHYPIFSPSLSRDLALHFAVGLPF